jgi:PAS domain S-box-containing protein
MTTTDPQTAPRALHRAPVAPLVPEPSHERARPRDHRSRSVPDPHPLDGLGAARSSDLHRALERDELEVHFLPIVELTGGEVVGVEALARWHHDGQVLETGEFLALAERTGRISDIGAWVIREACLQVASWNAAHADRAPLRLAVNISAQELDRPTATADIEAVLTASGLDPGLLSLEVREDSLQALSGTVAPTLVALKALGLRLSVDDFGTGATSVAALVDHHLDELKIDRRFVSRMDLDEDSAAVVRGIVRLAQSLRMHCVAEGVERAAQEQMLHAMGCDAAQGWLYARAGGDLDAVVRSAEEALVRAAARRPPAPGVMSAALPSARAAARFMEAVFQTSPIGMALVDGDGRHLAANPAYARLLGHPTEDIVGATCWETIHPTDLQADLDNMDALLRGEQVSYSVEERVLDAQGAPRWVQLTVTGVPSDQQAEGLPPFLLRQVQCIEVHRRSTEEATLLRSIVEASPDPLVITDARGRCTHWNPAAERLFGWPRDEMLGAPLSVLVPREDQATLARAASGHAVRWCDATWLSAERTPCPVDVTVGPVVDDLAGEVGLVVLARDVTDQREAAADLRRAHEAMALHATELAAANERLADFATTLTHDLMQPVSSMSGFLSLLHRGAPELDDEHRSWLDAAVRGRDRIVQAIDALYRHATAEELPLGPVDLQEVVAGLLPEVLTDPARAAFHEPLPVVCGDAGLITQVFANLLQNAARYRDPDRELEMRLDVTREPRSWVVTVGDNGQGIAPEDAERVFEPGVRGGAAAGTAGTGTGLSTVRSLMQRMGGTAWVEPNDGVGARISLRFAQVDLG